MQNGKTPIIPTAHPKGDPLHAICKGECGQLGHGLYDATTDPVQLAAWWDRWPLANIGLRTGVAFDVLDIDTRDPWEATANVWPAFDWPGGPVVSTAKGWHFYVAITGATTRTLLAGASCDWRGHGGYVVAPPSWHASGVRYSWHTPADLALQPVPPELRTLLDPPKRKVAPATSTLRGSWNPRGIIDRVANATEGERNDVLNWAAYRIGCDVYERKATEDDASRALGDLYDAAQAIGLSEREIDATISSGYSKGAQGVAA